MKAPTLQVQSGIRVLNYQKYKLQGYERSNCMGNTLKIRIFTIHTLHFHMVVTATHNKYMCIFHWGYQKRAHLSQTYIGLKTITKKYAPSMYVELVLK